MDDFSSAALGANFKGWHEKIKLRKDGFNGKTRISSTFVIRNMCKGTDLEASHY